MTFEYCPAVPKRPIGSAILKAMTFAITTPYKILWRGSVAQNRIQLSGQQLISKYIYINIPNSKYTFSLSQFKTKALLARRLAITCMLLAPHRLLNKE